MSSSTLSHAEAHMGDGDQHDHTSKRDAEHSGERQQEGKPGSHLANDPKDQRSVNNRAEAEKVEETQEEKDNRLAQTNPTAVARSHGNEPSKGAKIDEEIMREEEELLAKKDAAKSK